MGLTNLYRMVFPERQQNPGDIEHSTMEPNPRNPALPHQHLHDDFGRPDLDPSDNLNLFRHLTGIISHPSMSHTDGLFSSGGRPAANLGIYARVVHNERDAKRGFKYFSWLINGCLGLQIVVAAALTALGAAGGSRGAVTVFGAINTVFAGILTFLRGSGLPNRLKYYQTEWKRVREFIEQRERDFSRPGCELDVHAVAQLVEAMYEETKMDLEASTPDRFSGINSSRKSGMATEPAPSYKFPSITLPRIEGLNEKGKEIEATFGGKVKNLASEITHYAQEARNVARDLQAQKDAIAEGATREVKEYASQAQRLEHMFGDKVKDLATEIGERAHMTEQVIHDAETEQHRAVDGAIREAREHLERLEATARSTASGPVTIHVSHTEGEGTSSRERKLGEQY